MTDNHRVRRSQYISPYGVGAIYDIGKESFVATDITRWSRNSGDVIHLKRLESRLRIREFRMPPVSSDRWGNPSRYVEYARFPTWMFCPSCREMAQITTKLETGDVPVCESAKCKGKKRSLVPMRFVSACESGHLEDVDWHWWAHSRKDIAESGRCSDRTKLKFRTLSNRGSGLASLEIRCDACGAGRSLDGITAPGAVKRKCNARQPWERRDIGSNNTCDKIPRVLQRGASNLYYPKVVSALDIPTELEVEAKGDFEDVIKGHTLYSFAFKKMKNSKGDVLDSLMEEMASEVGCEIDLVRSILHKDVFGDELGNGVDDRDSAPSSSYSESEILEEEWPILVSPPADTSSDVFRAESFDLSIQNPSFGVEDVLENLVVVHKLREVRALRGFHRINPGDDDSMVPVDLGQSQAWLPAIEVFGEGIFFSLNKRKLQLWEQTFASALNSRVEQMQKNHEESGLNYLPIPTPRFVMLHTLSHILMRQLSFECGYSASSLRERIYCSSDSSSVDMAGVLIYTADSDSEGSLGGLAREGHPDRFIPTLLTALERSIWCSTDPICMESFGQGMKGLNMAACHACSLVSETSCVYGNVLLDRMMLIGSSEQNGDYGFFADIVKKASEKLLR